MFLLTVPFDEYLLNRVQHIVGGVLCSGIWGVKS